MSVEIHALTPNRRIQRFASTTAPTWVAHSTTRYGQYERVPTTLYRPRNTRIGHIIQWPSCGSINIVSRPAVSCRRPRVNRNAQSSRANHWCLLITAMTTTPIGHATHIVQRAAASDSARVIQDGPTAGASCSTSTDHQSPPQRQQLQHAARDRRQPEELRAPVRAEVVVYRRFHESRPGPLEAEHHLDADHTARRSQSGVGEQPTTEQPEITVGVADLECEHELDDVVVDAPDHLAVPRVATTDLVALHDVDRARGERHEHRGFAGVVLGVAVGVEDPLVRRRREAADQRLAVPAILRMVDDS